MPVREETSKERDCQEKLRLRHSTLGTVAGEVISAKEMINALTLKRGNMERE
jgi:hypothetical protein